MADIQYHPACLAWPDLPDPELKAMAEGIKARGFYSRRPVVRWHGMVIDGRQRLRACALAGVAPVFVDLDFENDAAVWDFVVDSNAHRRHMTSEDRARVILAWKEAHPNASERTVAEALKVPKTTVHRAKETSGGPSGPPDGKSHTTKGQDGKTYPARRAPRPKAEPEPEPPSEARAAQEAVDRLDGWEDAKHVNPPASKPGFTQKDERSIKRMCVTIADICNDLTQIQRTHGLPSGSCDQLKAAATMLLNKIKEI